MKRPQAFLFLLLAGALMAGCRDHTTAQPDPPPPENSVQLAEVRPAEVVALSLAQLGFPAGADRVTASGAVSDALLKDGTLRFSTPGDTGVDQQAAFEIQGGGTKTKFKVLIRSQRPKLPLQHIEPVDDGAPVAAAPPLTISGLGPNNAIIGAPLIFKLQGKTGLDLKDDSDGLVTGADNVAVSLNQYWVFNAADSSFSISGPAMQELLGALPHGSLNMVLNFVSKDGTFAVSYELLASASSAKLSGKLQSPQGEAGTWLAGRKILLKGFNSETRAVAVVDSTGAFTFAGLVPDTYQMTLSDLQNPNVISASTEIFADTTQADVTLVVPPGVDVVTTPKSAVMAKASQPVASYVASTATQNGKPPARRNPRAARAIAVRPASTLAADGSNA